MLRSSEMEARLELICFPLLSKTSILTPDLYCLYRSYSHPYWNVATL